MFFDVILVLRIELLIWVGVAHSATSLTLARHYLETLVYQ